jgi:hypothetical protein
MEEKIPSNQFMEGGELISNLSKNIINFNALIISLKVMKGVTWRKEKQKSRRFLNFIM